MITENDMARTSAADVVGHDVPLTRHHHWAGRDRDRWVKVALSEQARDALAYEASVWEGLGRSVVCREAGPCLVLVTEHLGATGTGALDPVMDTATLIDAADALHGRPCPATVRDAGDYLAFIAARIHARGEQIVERYRNDETVLTTTARVFENAESFVAGVEPRAIAGDRLVHADLHPGNVAVDAHSVAHAIDFESAVRAAREVEWASLVYHEMRRGKSGAPVLDRVADVRAFRMALAVKLISAVSHRWWNLAMVEHSDDVDAMMTGLREFTAFTRSVGERVDLFFN